MLREVGLLTNCGTCRLPEEVAGDRVFVSVVFSMELLEQDAPDVINELREEVQETIMKWSRLYRSRLRQREKKKNAKRGCI